MHPVGAKLRVVNGNGKYLHYGDHVTVQKVVESGVDRYGPCRGYVVSNPDGGRDKYYVWDEDRFAAPLAQPGDRLHVVNGNGQYLRSGDTVKVLVTVEKGVDHTGAIDGGYITTNPRGEAKSYIWDADRFE